MAAITEKLEKDVRLERWLESRKGSRKIEYYYYHSADYPSFLTENETYKLHTQFTSKFAEDDDDNKDTKDLWLENSW